MPVWQCPLLRTSVDSIRTSEYGYVGRASGSLLCERLHLLVHVTIGNKQTKKAERQTWLFCVHWIGLNNMGGRATPMANSYASDPFVRNSVFSFAILDRNS